MSGFSGFRDGSFRTLGAWAERLPVHLEANVRSTNPEQNAAGFELRTGGRRYLGEHEASISKALGKLDSDFTRIGSNREGKRFAIRRIAAVDERAARRQCRHGADVRIGGSAPDDDLDILGGCALGDDRVGGVRRPKQRPVRVAYFGTDYVAGAGVDGGGIVRQRERERHLAPLQPNGLRGESDGRPVGAADVFEPEVDNGVRRKRDPFPVRHSARYRRGIGGRPGWVFLRRLTVATAKCEGQPCHEQQEDRRT